MSNVGIVIVSHSAKVAEGAADMVRQMVGDEVPLAYAGGNADGGLGTDVGAIMAAIDRHGRTPAWRSCRSRRRRDEFAKWPSRCWTRTAAAGWWCATRRSSKGRSSLRRKLPAVRPLDTVKRMAEELTPQ